MKKIKQSDKDRAVDRYIRYRMRRGRAKYTPYHRVSRYVAGDIVGFKSSKYQKNRIIEEAKDSILQYYYILRQFSTKYGRPSWFIESTLVYCFNSACSWGGTTAHYATIDIDELLDVQYKELDRAVRRWSTKSNEDVKEIIETNRDNIEENAE